MTSIAVRVASLLTASLLVACAGKKTNFDNWTDDTGRNRPIQMALEDERICGLEVVPTTRRIRECMEMKGWKAREEPAASGYARDQK